MSEKLNELRKWVQDAVNGGFTPVTIPTNDLVYLIEKTIGIIECMIRFGFVPETKEQYECLTSHNEDNALN